MSLYPDNPPYEVKNVRFEPYADFGDDMMNIIFDIHSPEFELQPFIECRIFLSNLTKMWRQTDPELMERIYAITADIPAIGPQESVQIEGLLSQGFDFVPHLTEWIRVFMPLREAYQQELQRGFRTARKVKEAQEGAQEVAGNLGKHIPGIREHNLLLQKIYKALYKVVSDEVFLQGPELLNSDPNNITKARDLINDNLVPLAESLTDLIIKAREEQG